MRQESRPRPRSALHGRQPTASGRSARPPGISAPAAEPELFAKPDDRWEINNVASPLPEVVEWLQDALTQYELALPAGRISDLPPLNDVLLHGLE